MKIRYPAVEGSFYPETKSEIENLIKKIEQNERYGVFSMKDVGVIGAILPHAGHIYSGYQTIPFFKYLVMQGRLPETIIILHPNHSGFGNTIALDENGIWKNSLGELRVDRELASLLPYPEDSRAHNSEHSCEVILPFIQYYFKDAEIKILPVSMACQQAAVSEKLAADIFEAVINLKRDVIIVASSDFSHFLNPREGFRKDQLLLDQISQGSTAGVEKVARDHRISACGIGPIMTLMSYSELVSVKYQMEVLARGHSGEVSPSDSVVDYVSMLFYFKNDTVQ